MNDVLYVVLPLYRCAPSIGEVVRRLSVAVDASDISVRLVLVDDGSPDDSMKLGLEAARANGLPATSVRLSRNFGQFGAILAGLAHCGNGPVVIMSADLQDPPELVPSLYGTWRAGSEIVIAFRDSRRDSRTSSVLSSLAYRVARRNYPNMPVGGFDFVLLSHRAAQLFLAMRGRHRFFQGDILSLGFSVDFIPYTRERRQYGRGGWSLASRIQYFFDLMLDSTYAPIKFMSRAGAIVAAMGAIYACVVVAARLLGQSPFAGWAPLMVAQLVIGGMLMMMLGVVGEYVWRIYDDLKDRPRFIVESLDEVDYPQP